MKARARWVDEVVASLLASSPDFGVDERFCFELLVLFGRGELSTRVVAPVPHCATDIRDGLSVSACAGPIRSRGFRAM
jgi:hypothetical protein